MPELPEVEFSRRRCERIALDQTIRQVHCADDPIVFEGRSAKDIESQLLGAYVIAVQRHGKYFWLDLQDRASLLLHLGMSGAIHLPGETGLKLSNKVQYDPERWPPKYVKLEIELANNHRFALCDPRRFARIGLRNDIRNEAPIAKLGFDPLLAPPSSADFARSLKRRKAPIKALLLQQNFIAGVGNWIADEVLYQSALDPRIPASDLTDAQVQRLYQTLRRVIEFAVSVDADKTKFPADWLFHYRWGKKSDMRMPNGQAVEFIECAGRTTAWVPAHQNTGGIVSV